jgi:hypothetical protein
LNGPDGPNGGGAAGSSFGGIGASGTKGSDGTVNITARSAAESGSCIRRSCESGYKWSGDQCACIPSSQAGGENPSPVLLDLAGDGFDLTDAAAGVNFDLDVDGARERLGWTAPGSDDSFLALDRNGNGRIDDGAELFGDHTPQAPSASPNGFLALAEFDRPGRGGNSDGVIDARDDAYGRLLLWRDADHDGASAAGELRGLSAAGVEGVALDYAESRRRDRHGNEFRYRARALGGAGAGRWAYDVFLVRPR